MQISMIIKLCLHFLFCQRVCSSSRDLLSSQNDTFFNDNFDNVLQKFFLAFNKVYLEIYKPRHITVIGASTNDFQQVQPLLESYSYIICKETEKCDYSHRFSYWSFVIVFIEDLSEEIIGKKIKVLSRCKECKILFIHGGMIRINDVWSMFALALQHNVLYPKLAHFGEDSIQLYSDVVAMNCSMEIRRYTVSSPEFNFDKMRTWAFQNRDMNGCPVSVTSLTFTPKIIIKENENGSLTIVAGREGKLVLALAKKLNFSIALRYPSMEDQLKHSRKHAILTDIATKISEIGIGRLRPTNLINTVENSLWYDNECITWGVPRVMNWANDIVWVEFSWEVWASVGLVFAIGCIIKYVYRMTVTSKKNSDQKSSGFVAVFLDAVALHLGNPVIYTSSSAGGRFMLTAYLYYAMVIVTAYKTSLASILATEEGTPTIVDAEGIVNANLNVGGSLYDYNILKDQASESEITSKLLERFVVNNNDSATWNKLFFGQGWAILGRRSFLNYNRQLFLKAQNSVTFNVLNGCVLAYPTVMIYQTGSLFLKPMDKIIRRLTESGIPRHWDINELDADKLLKHKLIEKYFEERATYKFRNIFILYFFCIAISVLTFLIELLAVKLDSRMRLYLTN